MGKERNSTEDREKQRPVEKVTNTQTGGIRLIALTHNLIFETFHLVTYIGKQVGVTNNLCRGFLLSPQVLSLSLSLCMKTGTVVSCTSWHEHYLT